MSSTNEEKRPFLNPYLWIFLVALSLRILFLVQWSRTPYHAGLVVDAKDFDLWALKISRGEWIPKNVFYQSPLYPYFLALIYKIFGHQLDVVRTIQIVTGSFSCVLFSVLGRSVFNPRTGIVAGFLAALYIPFIFSDSMILKSTWDIFFSLLFILYFLRTQEHSFTLKREGFLTGLWLGIAVLLRGNMIFLVPFVPLFWFFWNEENRKILSFRNFRDRIKDRRLIVLLLLYSLGVLLPILPVTLSNILIGKDRVLLTSTGGITFWQGNNAEATGELGYSSSMDLDTLCLNEEKYFQSIAESESGRALKPSEISSFWNRKAWEYIGSQPLSWIELLFRKFLLFWNHYEIPDNYNLNFIRREFRTLVSAPLISFGIIAPFAMVGIFLAWKERQAARNLAGFALVYMCSVILFFVSDRFRLPVVAYLIPLAAYAANCIVSDLRSRNRERLLSYAVLIPCSFAFCWLPLVDAQTHFPTAQEQLAYLYSQQKDNGKAVEFYGKAVESNPNSWSALNNMGVLLHQQKNYSQALDCYLRAVLINPDHAETFINLGVLYTEFNEYERALKAYQRVVELKPDDPVAYRHLGTLYHRMKNYGSALQCYQKAIQINPNDPETYYDLGTLFAEGKEFDRALESYKQAIVLDPNYDRAYHNMGSVFYERKDYPHAVQFYRQAIAINPESLQTYNNLAQTYHLLKDEKKAQEFYALFQKMKP